MVTVQAFTALMHTSQVMLVMATASSFWPLLSLGEVWESNSDVGVNIRYTLIVIGGANSPHIYQKWQKEKTGFSKLVLANTKPNTFGPQVQQHYYTILVLTQYFTNTRT